MTGTDAQRDAAAARPIALVRGGATPEELAIVMVVLARAARSAQANDPPRRRTSVWVERARLARRPLVHGPGAWRSSALPH
ncbi:acetyl-CoA carboxylase biotin carboxyl carrier protein subunit [Micromonospora sonchi]|uniref:Acetyl-CoA carboxylase biotin carboxyl carrier protein subunit n=1 Tax=Micromonospora sonchi TaxID=1763543 RepID=A0A917X2V6_9ACTN|nr:acyl-CoA carboxylase subunit epsilon [Micromonospora sonchi]GGM63352.1 acetyl-CoA carboxylase biotin carboxyl carrier protein subunit [Micromonospora sonchi]